MLQGQTLPSDEAVPDDTSLDAVDDTAESAPDTDDSHDSAPGTPAAPAAPELALGTAPLKRKCAPAQGSEVPCVGGGLPARSLSSWAASALRRES